MLRKDIEWSPMAIGCLDIRIRYSHHKSFQVRVSGILLAPDATVKDFLNIVDTL